MGIRRMTRGIQIGSVRLFWDRKSGNWRTKPYPYWFARNWDTVATVQSGPLEVWYYKRDRR